MSTPEKAEAVSPNGGSVTGRKDSANRFARRISVNVRYSRESVSYQGSRGVPGLRWLKYKEGFSRQLSRELLVDEKPCAALYPFAGLCTTPLAAAGR
ncbi:MAG: hypothetical protein OXI87_10500 [Albidovulum sp.]|nr:hypothetical protein [Albidovulum sp.]MDE0305296.1 hypothetical protein [Albidovulum sp.]MDE0531000.1 hypothetical protein [Albidovulum sp.]